MTAVAEALGEANSRWMSFCTHVGYAMLAGDLSAGYQVLGDRRRAQAENRIAIGEAAAVISRALDIRATDASWVPICDAMIRAADIHVAALEGQLSEFRRSAKIRTGRPSRGEQRQLAEMGIQWSVAILAARELYASLGGDPDKLTTFSDFYETLKAGRLIVEPPLTMPSWPSMEN